jgi:phosphoribosylformylglycinamidine synthase
MAKMAVDEAYRNLIAVGGSLAQAAILDNFCWGSSKDSTELAGLVRAAEGAREAATAYGLPFISGKDSFNNTWRTDDGTLHSIPPTLLVSAIGVLEDVRKCVTPGLKAVDNLLYLVGESRAEMRGSLAARIWNDDSSVLPDVNLSQSKSLYKKLLSAMKHGQISSAHDLSEGGLAVAAAEMVFGASMGLEIDLPTKDIEPATFLFSETPSRFLVEVSPENQAAFEQTVGLTFAQRVGRVIKKPDLVFKTGEIETFRVPASELKTIWKTSLKGL